MRLIDADALYDKYFETMKELIKSTTFDNVSLQSLSLLCGAKLVNDAPTINEPESEPVAPIIETCRGVALCGNCREELGYYSEWFHQWSHKNCCPNCGKKVKWDEID